MTVWCAGLDESNPNLHTVTYTSCRIDTVNSPDDEHIGVQVWMRLIQTCTPNGHLYRVTYTRCIDTIKSPDDGHMAARNM